ncbi:hypothetical protein JWZ98_00435 [Methylomonas sp. EFPC1]|uniref:hypothetical protein n=1 Tax=Methylomonas sp. EFPC1 TaxID=2812647 RepID=UPI00196732AD|nr:hypothetical protein [Methylomonas sp. EFPC1]QSB01474.1 hypothetical protein JWZ98_00435 [Methylomonas sp. EFPC1]
MNTRIRLALMFLSLTMLSGCVAYAPYAESYPATYTPYGYGSYSYGYSAPVVPVPVPMFRGGWGYGGHRGYGGHHGHGHFGHHGHH